MAINVHTKIVLNLSTFGLFRKMLLFEWLLFLATFGKLGIMLFQHLVTLVEVAETNFI